MSILSGKPIGIIFDWDGVVIDSRDHHKASWERLAEETGHPLPHDHFERGFGRRNENIFREILRWPGDARQLKAWADRKEEVYRDIVREKGATVLAGTSRLLHSLQEHHVPAAIGSSTPLANIELILDLSGLRPFFSAVVSGDDVGHGKPNPEVFLLGAQLLHLPPRHCLVFEDALPGIEAARNANMACVALTTTHPRYRLDRADRVVDAADELSVGELENLIFDPTGQPRH